MMALTHPTLPMVTFAVVVIGYSIGFGSALRVDVTKNSDKLNITCVADGPESRAENIITMQIMKRGQKPFGIVSHKGLNTFQNMTENMEVLGKLYKFDRQSYITLIIADPGMKDIGTYTCIMYYTNEEFRMNRMSANGEVTIEHQSKTAVNAYLLMKIKQLEETTEDQGHALDNQTSLVTHLKDKISALEDNLKDKDDTVKSQRETINTQLKTLKSQELRLTSLEKVLKHQEDSLKRSNLTMFEEVERLRTAQDECQKQTIKVSSRVDGLEGMDKSRGESFIDSIHKVSSKVNKLETNGKTQSKLLKDLVDKESASVAFSYGYRADSRFQNHQTLIFKDEIFTPSQGYNPGNGRFTAPRDGLYIFHLVVETQGPTNYIYIHLMAKGKTVASLKAKDASDDDQSSVTTIVALKTGDTVEPVVWDSNYEYLTADDHYSVFTGYLLHPL